jgi:hypothetical protein
MTPCDLSSSGSDSSSSSRLAIWLAEAAITVDHPRRRRDHRAGARVRPRLKGIVSDADFRAINAYLRTLRR